MENDTHDKPRSEVTVSMIEGLVVVPGDHVLLTTAEDWSQERIMLMLDSLRDRFPDVEFTLLNGITGIAMYCGEDDETDVEDFDA